MALPSQEIENWYPFLLGSLSLGFLLMVSLPITFQEFWPARKLRTDIPFSWVLYPWGSFPLYPLPITSQKFWPARKLRTDILFSGVLYPWGSLSLEFSIPGVLYPWGSLSLGFLSLTFPFLNIPGVFIRLVKVETWCWHTPREYQIQIDTCQQPAHLLLFACDNWYVYCVNMETWGYVAFLTARY